MITTITLPTADEITDLLSTILAGAVGGTEAKWRKLVGEIEPLPAWRYVTHNWKVTPTGTAEQRDAIERAVVVVRGEHPYIA